MAVKEIKNYNNADAKFLKLLITIYKPTGGVLKRFRFSNFDGKCGLIKLSVSEP